MGGSSIPSCNPVTGRTSTRSLSRSRRSSSNASAFISRSAFYVFAELLVFNAERRISRLRVGRSAFGVGRWAFSSAFGRVKGAWWPSRSSKPPLAGNGRDRFDSYPLRHFMFDGRGLRFEVKPQIASQPQTSKIETSRKGVNQDAARANS